MKRTNRAELKTRQNLIMAAGRVVSQNPPVEALCQRLPKKRARLGWAVSGGTQIENEISRKVYNERIFIQHNYLIFKCGLNKYYWRIHEITFRLKSCNNSSLSKKINSDFGPYENLINYCNTIKTCLFWTSAEIATFVCFSRSERLQYKGWFDPRTILLHRRRVTISFAVPVLFACLPHSHFWKWTVKMKKRIWPPLTLRVHS